MVYIISGTNEQRVYFSSKFLQSVWLYKVARFSLRLFKSGSMVELDNYRPISILPVLSKILERIVYKQLLSHLENNGLLSSFQFGFRSKRSTELAVTYFTDKIRKEVDNGNILGAVFIDLSKAFDTVSHSRVSS